MVECLSNGQQPDINKLSKVGYLYRTTAVYGSGKFGLADRFRIKNRDEILGPFRARDDACLFSSTIYF